MKPLLYLGAAILFISTIFEAHGKAIKRPYDTCILNAGSARDQCYERRGSTYKEQKDCDDEYDDTVHNCECKHGMADDCTDRTSL